MLGKVVLLYGPDGSGKTTIARLVAAYLKSKGLRVKISWMRGTHTLASILARMLVRHRTFRGGIDPYYGLRIPNKMGRLWILIELISFIPILIKEVFLPQLLGYIVIAERSPLDFLVWLSLVTEIPLGGGAITRGILWISKRYLSFYISANLECLLKRRREDNPKFIKRQIPLYEKIHALMEDDRINTTRTSSYEAALYIVKRLSPAQKR